MILRRIVFIFLLLTGCLQFLSAQVDDTRMVRLSGRVHPQATPRNDRGAVDGSWQLPGITLLLKPSAAQQAGLEQMLAQQQDPSSPNFHRWLTPEQFADRFGVSADDLAKISDWLKSQGFTITNVARSRTWISVSGSAAQAGKAFHTAIHRYNVNGESHYANATDPSVPAALADLIAGFRGLNDFHPKPRFKRASNPDLTMGSTHHIAPDDLAVIYDITALYQASVDGTGQKIAVVGQSAIHASDIQAFRTKFNLPVASLEQVPVPGRPDPGIVSGDVEESDLDLEWSAAVARNATVMFVYSDDVWQSVLYAVDQNVAPVLSMSYGNCEQSDLVDLPSFQAQVRQANAEGITFLAAAGDSGAADCEDPGAAIAQNGLAVDVPGSIPEVTSMGGTEFMDTGGAYWSATNTMNSESALSYIPEQAWNDSNSGGLAATGGGASTIFPRPSWQTAPGVPNDGFRHVPDLSFSASANHDGYYIYSGGGADFVGGTSVAAPVMAGIVALLNQYLVSTGIQQQPGLGNINPTLYRLAQSAQGVFHDVSTGNNNVTCVSGSPDCASGSFGLSAGAGYDQVTGLGSVDAYNLVHQWSSKPALNSGVVASVDQNPVFQTAPDANGNSWVFKMTLSEEAGIGTTLTDFTVDGTSYASQIATLFGSASIPANGSISAPYGFKTLTVPTAMTLGFTGIDASGAQWTTQILVHFNGAQALSVTGLANAASGQQVYAPGMIMSIYGSQLGNFAQSAGTLPLPNYLAGFEATINGVQAPLYYVSPNQVNVQIPYETRPGGATLMVGNPYQNVTSTFQVAASGPGIFTTPDGSISPSNTGSPGQTATLFITGDGQVTPTLATGSTPSARTQPAQLPKPRLGLSVTVGGVPAAVQFFGIPNGLVGVTQVNFTIPESAPTGQQPVVVTVGAASSAPANINVAASN
jgi:uncharacterized protein (TIGR03437 family)